ncbi:hypothetical protein [Massilia sp. Leaf139]|uniref:hypothetical protein n=1 Tax=Massilia sp. Leaf139 TaxID=1736272 RepID=UPI0006F7E17E|nr:hypothetical protein [Massilia sp. Leaf139]KQQ96288.1 N-terminal double-transmembrane domain-containing protein [Massilia sp. Leaf139]
MTSLWWLALPTLLLPIWWHRKKRVQVKAEPLASARFLPRTEPRQMRVWRWSDILLLIVRCLLLVCAIAWLADPVFPWRGDTVVVAQGTDARWVEREIKAAGYVEAARLPLPAHEALAWIGAHEREFKPEARLLVLGDIPMPAGLPAFRRPVALRTLAAPVPRLEARVAIVSARAPEWRRMFAALDGPLRVVLENTPGPKTELIVWDMPDAPPAGMRAPLWWTTDTGAFTELAQSKAVGGIRYADGARGRVWASNAWPPADPGAARALLETWRELHYAPVPYTAPPQAFAPSAAAARTYASGALRDFLMWALVALFAIERILTHARRR